MKIKTFVVFICLVLLVSCSTTETGYSESDANYVMNLALDNSISRGITKTASYISETENFIPSNCTVLENRRNDIAGLDTILTKWTDYARNYTLDITSDFQTMVGDLRETTIFENPVNLAQGSPTSVTKLFKDKNYSHVRDSVLRFYDSLDTSLLEQAVSLYNRWIQTNNSLNSSRAGTNLVVSMIKEALATDFTDTFFSFMASSEELYRTTPQPDMENVVERVLGLE